MKAVFFGISEDMQGIIKPYLEHVGGLEYVFYEDKLSTENVDKAKGFEILSVFVNSLVTKEIIDSLPEVKLIVTRSTGFDHIDIEYAKQKEIVVSSVPGYGSYSVAEHAFALMLTLSRRIFNAYHQVRESGDFNVQELQGFDLNEKTLGVIGTGRIGKNVVIIAKGFGMNIIAYDPFPDEEFAREKGFNYVSLDELLAKADIVTLHAPYIKEKTHHLLNKGNMSKMKKGVYIINTARGELIDTDALLEGLKSGQIAGAGLDVLEGERELKEEAELVSGEFKIHDIKKVLQDHVLIDMPQVVISPHIASHTIESDITRLKTTAENIKSFIDGNPQNIVKQ